MTKIKLLLTTLVFSTSLLVNGQTMTFDNGPVETGFTLDGWDAAGGTIWMGDLAGTATITKDAGTWDFISFEIGPFVGGNQMRIESNLGDVYDYGDNILQSHTVNWTGITSITFSRLSGSGAAGDHDNLVYSPSVSVDIESQTSSIQSRVYPNPTTGAVVIDLGKRYSTVNMILLDVYGRVVSEDQVYDSKNINTEINGPAGLYSVLISGRNMQMPIVLRVIKL